MIPHIEAFVNMFFFVFMFSFYNPLTIKYCSDIICAKGCGVMKNINYIIDKYANLITIRDPMFVIVGDTYYLTGTQPSYWKGINNGVHL